jgi:hypothetical protein
VREDFFLGGQFRDLADLNAQLHQWLDTVANVRTHATTRRVVAEHFAEEHPSLQGLPAGAFQAVLRMERRITRDGMVSVNGNLYSVPNATRRHPVEVHRPLARSVSSSRIGGAPSIPSWKGVASAASRQGIAVCHRQPTAIRRVSRADLVRSWPSVPWRSTTLSRAALPAWEPGHDGRVPAGAPIERIRRAKHCLDEASHLSHSPAHELRH